MLLGGVEMKASNWMVAGLFVLSCAAAASSEETTSTDLAVSERIRIQEQRLPEIERIAAQEREQIEQWYATRPTALAQEKARWAAAHLSLPLRTLWTEFAKMHRGQPYAEGYFDAADYGFPISFDAAVLRYTMEEEYFVSEMANLLLSEDFRQKLTQIANEYWQIPLLRDEAARLLTWMEHVHVELTMELGQLEKQRDVELDAVSQWEQDLQEQVRGILEYLKESEGRKTEPGVVEAIGYGPQGGYFCTVEGVEEILRPGDMARGVRVVSIDPEKVEFAKNGTTWTQGLGGPPQPHWD